MPPIYRGDPMTAPDGSFRDWLGQQTSRADIAVGLSSVAEIHDVVDADRSAVRWR
jgi:hypothetical protein